LHHALRRSLLRIFLPAFAIVTAVACVATQPLTRYPLPSQLALGAVVALGVLTLVALGGTAWRRAREREAAGTAAFLLVWVVGVATYCVVFLPFSAARYLLPAYPAVLLLLLSDPAWTLTTRARRAAVAAVLAASALFGLASAYSDYRFASTYREFAATLAETKAPGGRDRAVWYVGEWGMRYYMDAAGARYLHADSTEPVRGDLVVIPEMPRFWAPSPELRSRMRPVGRKTYASPLPLRLFNARSRAGFYAQFIGMLPFALSSEPDEVFQVYEVFR
jgi:hypothetical protein